jgi:hypothetical protein
MSLASMSPARSNLLIYVPAALGATDEAKQEDPREGFARCGAVSVTPTRLARCTL